MLALVIGTGFGLTLLLASIATAELPAPGTDPHDTGYVAVSAPPRGRYEVVLNTGDGQAYAALAQDPALLRPEVFFEGPPSASYFAQRPLLVYLLWALSLGQPGLLPAVFVAVSAVATGLYAAANTWWAQRSYPDRVDAAAILLLLLPGALAAVFFGPNLLGIALAMAGFVWWRAPTPRRGLATACFVGAGLCRETMFLFPLVAGWLDWRAGRLRPREVAQLALGPVVLAAWTLVVWARVGPPTGKFSYNFGLPFVGVVRSVSSWGPLDWIMAVALVALVAYALVRRRDDPATWIALLFAVSGVVLTTAVWSSWQNFARVLLPAYTLPLLQILPRREEAAIGESASSSG